MGQYLMVGLKQAVSVEKEYIRKYVKADRSEQDILAQMEKNLRLDKFIRTECDGYYQYELDKNVLERELLVFMKRFYALRYIGKYKSGSNEVISMLETLPTIDDKLEFLDNNPCESFQYDKRYCCFYVDDDSWFQIPFICREIILSMDGKIFMECYNDILDFFRRCIVTQFEDLELSSAIDVYISD